MRTDFSTLCMPLRRPSEDLVTEIFFTSLLDKHYFFSIYWISTPWLQNWTYWSLKMGYIFQKKKKWYKSCKNPPRKKLFKKSSIFGTRYTKWSFVYLYIYVTFIISLGVFSITLTALKERKCSKIFIYFKLYKALKGINSICE